MKTEASTGTLVKIILVITHSSDLVIAQITHKNLIGFPNRPPSVIKAKKSKNMLVSYQFLKMKNTYLCSFSVARPLHKNYAVFFIFL
jgi:hypothetical protein